MQFPYRFFMHGWAPIGQFIALVCLDGIDMHAENDTLLCELKCTRPPLQVCTILSNTLSPWSLCRTPCSTVWHDWIAHRGGGQNTADSRTDRK